MARENESPQKARFWTGCARNIPYTKIRGVNYSEVQMRRINKKSYFK